MLLALFSRPLARLVSHSLSALLLATAAFAQTPSPADGFDPNSDGNVLAVATQADGKIVVGGQFSLLRTSNLFGVIRNNIARYSSEGSLDDSFDPNANGPIRAIAIQPDGKILIGGDFTSLRPNGAATATTRTRLARLNPDGSLDTSFNAAFGGLLLPQVHALALQADGRIVVGGSFTTVQGTGASAPTNRNYLARLNADGSLDASYNPNPSAMVLALALHVDGKMLVGGGFVRFTANGASEATLRNRIARLNPDGTVDSEFDPNANNGVSALAVQRDGKIVVGGFFTTMQPLGYPPRPVGLDGFTKLIDLFKTHFPNENLTTTEGQNAFNVFADRVLGQFGVTRWEDLPVDFSTRFTLLGNQPLPPEQLTPADRNRLARLNVDGSLDTEFVANTSGNVQAVGIHPDGGVIVGGSFAQVWGRGATITTRNNLVRFNPDGTLDVAFNPNLNQSVNALAFQTDGRIVAAGYFTHAQPAGATTPITRNRVARLYPDGSLDATFDIDQGGRPLATLVQADGKIIIAGSFTSIGGVTRNYMARVMPDGTLDPTYNPNLNGRVFGMVPAPDNKIYIAGAFTRVGGDLRLRLARLNPDGTVDSEYHPEFDGGDVGALAVQSDGKLLVGGSFTVFKPHGVTEPITNRPYFIRLNANGTLDEAFDPSPNSKIATFTLQSDGKILVGGDFLAFSPGGTTNPTSETFLRFSFARINADGTVDRNFNPSLSGQVSSIVVQSDGKIVAGGIFTSLQPQDPTERDIPRRNRLVRYNADGTLDTTFDPNANGPVISMAVQSDNKIVIGGSFTTLQPPGEANWILRKYVARLNADGTVDSTFNLDLNEQSGNRVDSVRIQPDGKILVGGSFISVQPVGTAQRVPRKYLVRVNANGSLDTGFEVDAAGSPGSNIRAFAIQSDSRVIAVGAFSDLGGAKSTNIARFNPEGPPDPTFSGAATADGTINAIALRPNGRLVTAPVDGFAWLNRDGNLRTGFNPGPASPIVGDIFSFAQEADGGLLLAGAFVNPASSTTTNLVRFSPAGVLDQAFKPSFNASVSDVAVQADGKIVVVGTFTNVNGVDRNRVARLNRDGTVDPDYNPNSNGKVTQVILLPDGKTIVAGSFTGFVPKGESAAVPQPYIARLNTDGSLDKAFATIPSAPVYAIAYSPHDQKILLGGEFTIIQSNSQTLIQTRNRLARLNYDGTLDSNFDPNVNGPVNSIALNSNAQVVFGGAFSVVQPNGSTAGVTRNGIARVNFDGSLDQSFNPNANGAITTLAVQSDDSVVFAGVFTTIQPTGEPVPITRNHLARVTNTGAVDFTFNPDVNGEIYHVDALADGSIAIGGNFTGLQPTGAIVVGGSFLSIGGVPARNLALLNDNGSVSASFQPRPDGVVNALLALTDGRVVVGGAFSNLASAARGRLARFNADGSLDAAFNPNADGEVLALALQPDGKYLVGGRFSNIGGQARPGFARLNADGTLDASFAPGLLTVRAIAVQADGRIVIVSEGSGTRHVLSRLNLNGGVDGSFAPISSGSASFNAITLQTDGSILVGGDFTSLGGTAVSRLARITADGTVDAGYNPAPDDAVSAVAVQADGRVVLGGGFTKIGSLNRVGLARLAPTSPSTQTLGVTADRTTVLWNRSGSGGELAAVIFEFSLDRITFTQLGFGTRVAGTSNWQLSGLSLPASGLFYIRARGVAPSVAGTSSGFFELTRQFNYSNPVPAVTMATIEMSVTSISTPMPGNIDPYTGITPRRAIMIVPGEGTVEIIGASETEANPANGAHLVNLSTRGRVTADRPLVLGFAVTGSEPLSLLLRAVGPGLTGFGVADALPATRIELRREGGELLGTNQGWANADPLTQAAARTGAFPLDNGSADSALLATLAPGNYTIEVVDVRGTGGVGLAEIYDAGSASGAARLVNVSTLGSAGQGNDALISGFVIAGGTAERVLLRGVGPGLDQFNVNATVADPSIALFDAQGRPFGGNDNWVSSVTTVSDAAARSGAFELDPGSKDAAVIATLPAGAYTVQVSAGGQAGGSALLEIYEVRK